MGIQGVAGPYSQNVTRVDHVQKMHQLQPLRTRLCIVFQKQGKHVDFLSHVECQEFKEKEAQQCL